MLKFIALLSFLISIVLSCSVNKNTQADSSSISPESTNKSFSNKNESKTEKIKESEIDDNYQRKNSIKNSFGLITLSDKYPDSDKTKDKNDFIQFFNEDGSLWYEFTYYYDDGDGKFDYQNNNFSAFSFHPDYFLLGVKVVGEDEERYKVVVNEEKGITKYVRKNDKNLKLESWENHILNTFSIDVLGTKSKIYEKPNGKEIKPDFDRTERFRAVEIKGDWLKVKWQQMPDKKEEFETGWIRWKKDDILLIDMFYFA